MKNRSRKVDRMTSETDISVEIDLDGKGENNIQTGIPFLDHMLKLFAVHGFFDLTVTAKGDLEVDFHHTVEDVGLVLGDAIYQALGERIGITRYGFAVTPMDETLCHVTIDLSNRPYLVYNVPQIKNSGGGFDISLAKEFFRALATRAGMNLHINVLYGENEHHILESIFKSLGRSLDQSTNLDPRIVKVRSSKGVY